MEKIKTPHQHTNDLIGDIITIQSLLIKIEDKFNEFLSSPKKEYNGLPLDEEINDYGWKWSDSNNGHGTDKYFAGCNFVCGAKWMRDIASSELESLKAEIAELKNRTEWITSEPPKNGTRIIRWHKIGNVPAIVFYKENFSPHKYCVWIESTVTNAWPEESFLPNIWMLPPTK